MSTVIANPLPKLSIGAAAPSTSTTCTCAACSQPALERVRYFPRQLLTVDDMVTDQNYFREKLRRHNRYLHGFGVVCGLTVTPSPADGAPFRVAISAGYAVSPLGDEIYVADTVYLNLALCAAGDTTDPCDPTVYNPTSKGAARDLYIAIQYAECFARPVRSMAAGCGCADDGCEFSRIRDSFELGCIPKPSGLPVPSLCEFLSGGPVPCPPTPADGWVVLAHAILPNSSLGSSSSSASGNQLTIDNSVRQLLFSTALIQQQVIDCCCNQTQPVPVQVSTVDPKDGDLVSGEVTQVVITFNKNLQDTSVNGQSVIVQPTGGKPLTGTVKFDQPSTARFIPATPISSGDYDVIAMGTGPSPITDVDNLALDGIGNGKPGSNHKTSFSVQNLK